MSSTPASSPSSKIVSSQESTPSKDLCKKVSVVALSTILILVGAGIVGMGIGMGVSRCMGIVGSMCCGAGSAVALATGAAVFVGVVFLVVNCGKRNLPSTAFIEQAAVPPSSSITSTVLSPSPTVSPPPTTPSLAPSKPPVATSAQFFAQLGFKKIPVPHTPEGIYTVQPADLAPLKEGSVVVRTGIQGPDTTKPQFTKEAVRHWFLGEGDGKLYDTKGVDRAPCPTAPELKKEIQMPRPYKPTAYFEAVSLLTQEGHPLSGCVGVFEGSLDALQLRDRGKQAAVAISNDGDLRGCCGYALAKTGHLAIGPDLQTALYNVLGVSPCMSWPDYAEYYKEKIGEGRGYAITGYAGAMEATSGIQTAELLTVPWGEDPKTAIPKKPQLYDGLVQMYYEAMVHSAGKDYLIMPMIGATHPLLSEGGGREVPLANLNARLALQACLAFKTRYPDSPLKVIFVVYDRDKGRQAHYAQYYRDAWEGVGTTA